MISDVLFDAKYEIERYLADSVYANMYSDQDLRNRLEKLVQGMEAIRIELDTSPSEEEIFIKAIDEIEKRCSTADIKFSKHLVEDGLKGIDVYLPQARAERKVFVADAVSATSLLKNQFENYKFLTTFNAICSYADKYVEAIIAPFNQISTEEVYQYLFGITPLQLLEFFPYDGGLELEVKSNTPIATITIGPVSQRAKALLGNLPDKTISLKIEGISISNHDQTLGLLTKIANSILFQIDLTLDLPLSLQRLPNSVTEAVSGMSSEPFRLDFPKSQYDENPMSLYWYARSADEMPLQQYLSFYQLIEFYFPLYSKLRAKQTVQTILKTPGFNVHNDLDVLKLINVARAELGDGFGSERSQLDATLQACIDIASLREFLENNEDRKEFLSRKQKRLNLERVAISNTDDELRKSIVSRIYDIRCRIVHTKSESGYDDETSIFPFTDEASLLVCDIELIHYIARQILIFGSSELNIAA